MAEKTEKKQSHDANKKEVTIIVNAQEKLWGEKEISYRQLVELAYGEYLEDENIIYTISFFKGKKPNHEGTLVDGEDVKVKNMMVFTVTKTNKS